jgi:hypothetical protein
MFKNEAERILETTKLEDQKIITENGKTLKIGDTKKVNVSQDHWVNEITLEIVAFAEPKAHGFDGKWDDAKDEPAVVLKRQEDGHSASEYEIKIAWEF